ncbi:MAG: terminase small subunit [Proteobacteria bacterium]|nr:terminase small subunit [Pseudomonadota bacterium]
MKNHNLVNRTELSSIFGKNVSTIDNWIRQGMPYIEKGSKGIGWMFDTSKCIAWRETKLREDASSNEKIDLDEAKRRKIAAEAKLLEIELQKKQEEVILRLDVEQGLTHAYLTIKQRLRTLPDRIVPQLAQSDEQFARELLINEIDDILQELSQLDFDENYPQENQI